MSSMYTLTAMTGREASATRSTVVLSFELNWRVLMVLLCCSPVALFVTIVGYVMIGQVALFLLPAVEALGVFLFHRRSTQGLRLRTYQSLMDKGRSNVGSFMLCGEKLEIDDSDFRTLRHNTVAYRPEPVSSATYLDQLVNGDAAAPGQGEHLDAADEGDLREGWARAGTPSRRPGAALVYSGADDSTTERER